jgi:hypothetical protein
MEIAQIQSIDANSEIFELTKYLVYVLFAGVFAGVCYALKFLFVEVKDNKALAKSELKEVNDRLIIAESDIKLNGSHDKNVDKEIAEIKLTLKEIKTDLSGFYADIKSLLV